MWLPKHRKAYISLYALTSVTYRRNRKVADTTLAALINRRGYSRMIKKIVLLEGETAKNNYEKSITGNHGFAVCIGDIGQSVAIHEVAKI
ncbi:hypothetical protein C5S39_11515 [Candidatus Methanophagaceae archaeon]|nr:hypothetical protein C5S39_11515 [Methanophagales archaeon]